MCLLFADSSIDFIKYCRHVGTISSSDLDDIITIFNEYSEIKSESEFIDYKDYNESKEVIA